MLYRKFGNTGIDISVLGFGAMRLPASYSGGKTVYDYEESARMMARAYELGVNYFDTAPLYCDCESETITGRALKPFRDKVYVSTKYAVSSAKGSDLRRGLEASLKKLDMSYIDFYHFWGITWETYKTRIIAKGGPLEEARRSLEEGLIRRISFSFHDDSANLPKIAESGNFETVLAQYNLLDRSNETGLAKAHALGMGTVVMGPVGGGRLGAPSEKIRSMIPGGARSNPELALRFVLTNPTICCALSGMSSMQQVEENCATASVGEALSPLEMDSVAAAMRENKKMSDLYCTGCKYCMPCPKEVNIPRCFELMNYHRVYEITGYAMAEYKNIGAIWMPGKDASHCTECGECEPKCPQKLSIREQLKEVQRVLG